MRGLRSICRVRERGEGLGSLGSSWVGRVHGVSGMRTGEIGLTAERVQLRTDENEEHDKPDVFCLVSAMACHGTVAAQESRERWWLPVSFSSVGQRQQTHSAAMYKRQLPEHVHHPT